MILNQKTLRLFVDASILAKGGGVQVAYSFICNIVNDPLFEITLVVSPQLDLQLPLPIKTKIKNYYVEKNEPVWKKFKQAHRLKKMEELHCPDLVFVIFGPSYWRPKAPCVQGFALPLLVYPETRNFVYRNNLKQLFYQKLLNFYKGKFFKNNADFAVVETETFKKKLSTVLNFNSSKIYVIENSFNANFMQNISFLKKQDSIVNIFVPSAFYPHKNLEILIDVAEFLVNKHQFKFIFNFLISADSPEWKRFIQLATARHISHCFSTYGVVPNAKMKELYIINDFILLPTLAEASTAVYPESFISKRVLLTSDIDFARELCGNAAVFFDPLDARDIAEKIITISADSEQQAQLIHNGLERVKNVYLTPDQKWLKQRNMLLSLLENLK